MYQNNSGSKTSIRPPIRPVVNSTRRTSEDPKAAFNRGETYIVDNPSSHLTAIKAQNPTGATRLNPLVRPSQPRQNSLPNSQTPDDSKPSKPAISLAALKQQKRAEMQKFNLKKPDDPNEQVVISGNGKSIDFIIRSARKTGQLNLSDYGLTEVPRSVWNINIDKGDESPDKNKNNVSLENEDFKWWDQVELSKLILASNKIKQIPRDIQQLNLLTVLDIHDNQIETIDNAIGALSGLQNFNCSHNQLKELPNGICELKKLINFNSSNNRLFQLPKNFGHLDDLEDLNVSNNSLNIIPKSFGWLIKLRKMNLATNSLTTLIPEIFYSQSLKIIDLSENQIEILPAEINELSNLEQFYARQNRIKIFPTFYKCCKLKDLDMSFNQIKEIEDRTFENLTSLVNFNLRDNKLTSLSKSVKVLQNIERLDLSNNDLSGLPFELAGIESLKQLLINGNPLRTIRRDIINRGTDAILKSLKNHLEVPEDSGKVNSEEMILKSDNVIKSSKVFDLSCKKLTSITPNMINFCKQSTALVFNATKNSLTDLPDEIEILSNQLNELNISSNLFTTIPRSIFSLNNLASLDVRANKLNSLPDEFAKLTALRELIISDNKFIEIPSCVYQLPILENFFANNNQIKVIDANRIINMKFLATLNLQNNDIMNVPPELGKAEQIKSLQLEGNPFKIPRTQILAKGTNAIMEYLRGRLTET